MYFKTDGIVIKSSKTTGNDLILTIFTRKAGKLSVIAKNARHVKSSHAAASKIFTFGSYGIKLDQDYYKLSSSEIHDSHFPISENVIKYAYGMYFLEWINYITFENHPDIKLFNFVVDLLDITSKSEEAMTNKLRAMFLVKISQFLGIQPNLSTCSNCGEFHDYIFSLHDGGLICKKCIHENTKYTKLNDVFVKLINYYLHKDISTIIKTKIDDRYNDKIISIFEPYLMLHLDLKSIKSKSFLDAQK